MKEPEEEGGKESNQKVISRVQTRNIESKGGGDRGEGITSCNTQKTKVVRLGDGVDEDDEGDQGHKDKRLPGCEAE